MRIPVVKECWDIVSAVLGLSAVLLLWGMFLTWPWLSIAGAVGVVLAGFLVWFFRDPEREPERALKGNMTLSPADGVVVELGPAKDPLYIRGKAFKASIFMNVFNCHVQRAPFDGKVVKAAYYPGKFLAANADKASLDNEQSHLVVRMKGRRGKGMVIKQIAGLIARRVVTDAKKGQSVERGGRIGRILLGSRVEVFFPRGFKPMVRLGGHVKAGVTVLGVVK
jgi:phosphatidylserine decarboxylase